MRVNITNFGGVIQSIEVPDRSGRLSDVSLGFRNLPGYEANTTGRTFRQSPASRWRPSTIRIPPTSRASRPRR